MIKKNLLIIFNVLLFSSLTFLSAQTTGISVYHNGVLSDLDGNVPANTSAVYNESAFPSSINDFTVYPGYPAVSSYAFANPKDGGIAVNMDADPDLEIVYGSGSYLYARNLDTTSVPGWPKVYQQYYEVAWTPAYGDIDGDGQGEVVAGVGGPLGGYLYAYEQDGTQIFSINIGKYPVTPVLSDLNGDGAMEIIIGLRAGQVYVYNGDGTVYNGWPQSIDHYIASSCAVGDINNDGTKEIVAEGRNFLYVWDSNGTMMPGFPYLIYDTVDGSNSYSAPVLADLFGDGNKEIMFCSHSNGASGGIIYAVKNDGTSLPGWPNFVDNWIYAPVSIADVNNDGQYDVVIGEYGASATPAFYLYAYNRDGSLINNYPIGPLDGMACQAAFADLDNDGELEMILDRNGQDGDQGSYYAFNMDGTPVTGFPLQLHLNTSFNQPVLADFNNDGTLDMFGGSFEFLGNYETDAYAWNTGLPYDATTIVNSSYQYNPQHDGVFVDPSVIPVELNSFTAGVDGNNVNLMWTTATEKNNAFFELYRNDTRIGTIQGSGTTTKKHSYSFTDENLKAGTYSYKLFQQDYDGTRKMVGTTEASVGDNPVSFTLDQNYPNPFNPTTVINYSLPSESFVTLKVYDVMGKEVRTLVNEKKSAGSYNVNFNAENLAAGLYVYQLRTENFVSSKKMMLLK
jgi:uncharacterized protein (DUF2141 family)